VRLDDHAILVGISNYPALEPLKGPCRDALDFLDWLLDPAGGDVAPANVKGLLSSNDVSQDDHAMLECITKFSPPDPKDLSTAHPRADEIERLFDSFLRRTGARVGRRLYIFLAGHGFSDPIEINSAALYGADADPSLARYVVATAYADFFRRNATFDEIALIMDCCRTTSWLQNTTPPQLPNISNPGAAQTVRYFYAFAAAWGQVSRETVIGGEPRGIFTATLLEALRLAQPDEQGRVTGEIVRNYIHNNVARIAAGTEIQPPSIPIDLPRDIVFFQRAAAPRTEALLKAAGLTTPQTLRVFDGSRREVYSGQIHDQPVRLSLAAGLYKARIGAAGKELLFEVSGERYEATIPA